MSVSVYFAGGILVEPTELLFTAQTWAQPQAVTVVAVDDNVAEAVEFASIWHNSTSSDPNYVIGSELIQRVNVTVISDDSAGLLVSASELAIAEGVGGEGTYSVRLSSRPVLRDGAASTVTVSVLVDGSEVRAVPSTLSFS